MKLPTPFFLLALVFAAPHSVEAKPLPNVVVILADDLGYGDVSCYNSDAKIATPHLDKLAAEGMRFTDAHSPSTVCTPTRYSLLTGRMAFRTGMRGVFSGAGGPCLIEEQRLTLPQMLRNKGSGGNNYDGKALRPFALPDTAPNAPGQLYRLDSDPGETKNLYFDHPEIAQELKDKLAEFKNSGRSVPLRK